MPKNNVAEDARESSDFVLLSGGSVWLWQQLSDLIVLGFTIGIVVGGVVPYACQYREILRTQNAKGFSAYVCLLLLVANILRVMFWLGKYFEIQLLMQSILMIITMLIMIELAARTSRSQILPAHHNKHAVSCSIWDGHIIQKFWQWTDFSSYLVVTTWFSAAMLFLTFLLRESFWYVEVVGFLALFTEAMLGAPQFYNNFKRKSTYGMSRTMVIMWLCGDTAKTGYFLAKHTPAQFYICGTLQVCVDLAILAQVAYYGRSSTGKKIGGLL